MRQPKRLTKKDHHNESGTFASTPIADNGPMPTWTSRQFWAISALLFLLSVFTFWPVLDNGFVDLDDEDGFVKNGHLLDPAGDMVRWAWTSYYQGVYQPLSRTMYWVEASIWGVIPRGFHGATLALHSINAVVLFALTLALIRRARPPLAREQPGLVVGLAALSVGLFVVHPLRAEVVAWSSVQAYEPSVLFAMLSVLAYLRMSDSSRAWRLAWLGASVALFAISLGFYGITLCLPLVLLVLDVYPLRRLVPDQCSRRQAAGILLEKLPYIPLSLTFAGLNYLARVPIGTVTSLSQDGLGSRLAASGYASCFYLIRTLLPVGLGPIHPMPDQVSLVESPFGISFLIVVAISFAAFRFRRRWPALVVVWVSFLLLQLPSSGLVRFASTIAADRYSSITMLGVPALLTAGLCVFLGSRPRRSSLAAIGVVGGLAVVALIVLSRAECLNWRDSVSIWSHVAASHGRPEGFFESRIGRALADAGQLDEAEVHLAEAIRLSPGLGYAHSKLGLVLVAKGRTAEAFEHFAEAVRLEPRHVESRINLGFACVQLGRFKEAEVQLAEAVRLQPALPEAQANLGAILVHLSRPAEAEVHLVEALRLAPSRPNGRMDLGYALAQQGKFTEAADLYAEQVRLQPDDLNARQNLGFVLEKLGRHTEAQYQIAESRRLDADRAVARTR